MNTTKNAMACSIDVLRQFWDAAVLPDECQNERYLHHYYSCEMQKTFPINVGDYRNSMLHPEWATWKETITSHVHCYSKYSKVNNKYYVLDKNAKRGGFIDFAIGDFAKPEFAIEFTSADKFSSEAMIFDFMKLLDSNNPFAEVLSFNLIFRENALPSVGRVTTSLRNTLQALYDNRNLTIAPDRNFLFWVIEIAPTEKRSWYCDNNSWNKQNNSGFIEALPPCCV